MDCQLGMSAKSLNFNYLQKPHWIWRALPWGQCLNVGIDGKTQVRKLWHPRKMP